MASSKVRIVISAMEGFFDQIVRKLVLDIVANLTAAPSEGGTPVDTGWARANWVPGIGTPSTSTVGSPKAVTETAQRGGIARMLGYKARQGPVHITNNVPYIMRLNEGWSRQAPSGFIQAAVAKAVRVDLGRRR